MTATTRWTLTCPRCHVPISTHLMNPDVARDCRLRGSGRCVSGPDHRPCGQPVASTELALCAEHLELVNAQRRRSRWVP